MGTSAEVDGRAPVHIFASSRSWIEGNATLQLEHVAGLPGVQALAAMPDLHPGKYGPVGCAILADRIHPQLVGSDIGCGMGLFELDVAPRKLRLDHLAERMQALDRPWDGDVENTLADAGLGATIFDAALGSIGGGNHFCEIQAIDEILAPDVAAQAASTGTLPMSWSIPAPEGLAFRSWSRPCVAAKAVSPSKAMKDALIWRHTITPCNGQN